MDETDKSYSLSSSTSNITLTVFCLPVPILLLVSTSKPRSGYASLLGSHCLTPSYNGISYSGESCIELSEMFSTCKSIYNRPPSSAASPSSCPDNMYDASSISTSITFCSTELAPSASSSVFELLQEAKINKHKKVNNIPVFFITYTP